MFIGIVLRTLRGWLHDYVGLDLDNSDYIFEHVSHNHVRFELKDVALTSAVWRFLVGPILPLTVQEGRVDQVKAEISPDTLSVQITGVTVRLRKLQPEEWYREADAYKTRLLKEKRLFASGSLSQTELRRWIKAKVRVSVLDAKAVLEESDWQRCAVLGYCKSVHVADPDHESWSDFRAMPCEAPWDTSARDAHFQMAKDVLISGVRGFFLAKPDLEVMELDGHFTEENALCPELDVGACYRNWDYGALHQEDLQASALRSARRVLTLHAACAPPEEASSLTLRLNAESYAYLTGLLANMDSLYFMWSAVLVDACKPAGRKPTTQEAERYVALWKQYLSGPSILGRASELSRLEDELLWGFCQRLRRLAEEELAFEEQVGCCGKNGEELRFCTAGSHSGRSGTEPLDPVELLEEQSNFEDELLRHPMPRLSPQIPEALWAYGELARPAEIEAAVLQCLGGVRRSTTEDLPGKMISTCTPRVPIETQRPPTECFADPHTGETDAPDEWYARAAKVFSVECLKARALGLDDEAAHVRRLRGREEAKVASQEFLLDSVYQVALPQFRVVLDFSELRGELLAVLEGDLPGFSVTYSSHLDCRFLAVSSNWAKFQETELCQSHAEAFKGAPALHWEQLQVESTNFGEMKRQVRMQGGLTVDLRRLWPYLRNFPGLRDLEPNLLAFERWFPRQPRETQLEAALAAPGVGRQTTYILDVPLLRLPLGSASVPALEVVAVNTRLSYSSLYGVHSLFLPEGQILCPSLPSQRGRPLLAMQEVVVERLGDFERNWAKVQLERVEFDLSPFLVLLLAKHLRAYDPDVHFSSSGRQERRPTPQMDLTLKSASLRLWPFDAEEPKVRLHLHMLELATVKSMVAPGLADAEGVMRLKLQGLIGDSLALAGGRSVFVCSALEGEPLQLRSALELSAAFTSERSRVVLVTLSVQLSPTQGLLDTWHLLAPLFTKTKTEGGADLDGIPAEYVEGDRRPEAQRAKGVASSQCCLIIHEVMANEPTVLTVDKELLVHGAPKGRYVPGKKLLVNIDTAVALVRRKEHLLHVTSGAFEAKESDEPPSVKCDDALATWGIMEERRSIWWTAPAASAGPVNLTMLSASSYGPVDFYQITLHPSDGRDWRPAELRLKRLGVSVAQARRCAQVLYQRPRMNALQVPSGAKELHAGGVFVTWLAVLHQIQVLSRAPAAFSAFSAYDALSRPEILSCRAAALRVGRLALWSSGVKDEPEEMESHERAELLRLCPMRPDEEEPFYRLLKLPGAEKTSPWLALTLQGVWQEDRFHTMEPYLREGCAVFRDASGEHFLCSRFGQAWSKSSPSGEMRGLDPQKVRFHADRKVLSLDLAPTQLLLRRMDLLPLRRLVRNLQELGQLRPKREAPQPLSRAHAREADRMPCARWQILLRADIEVRLAELPACPSLVLRCRPSKELARGAAKLMVRLEDFAIEPTALRLHCAWMQPVASLLWGLTWWRQQSRLQEPEPEMGLGLVPVVPKVEVASDVVSPTATGEDTALQPWHGTVWLLPWEPVGEQAPAGARVALQIPADGTLWARRQSTAWLPLNNNSVTTNYRHFSTQIFPHGLCCTGAEFAEGSRCCVAFDAEEDKDAVVRIFAALHFQRVRKSSPPVISVPASSITTRAPRSSLVNTSARVFQRSKTVTTTLASRLASRSPASNRSRSVTSPFSKRSPATPAQARHFLPGRKLT
ncbi:unnamed protein product [Effrenium voratum]|nr:unnamed protein product [Effrenium voratum]